MGEPELREQLVRNAREKLAREFDLRTNTAALGALFAQCLGLRNWAPPERPVERRAGTVELG